VANLAIKNKNIFDEIRNGFITVHNLSTHVKVNKHLLEEYALSLEPLKSDQVFDTEHHFVGTREQTAAYTFILDSLNFGSGYAPLLVKEGWEQIDGSVYYTLSTNLKKYFEEHGVIDAAALSDIDLKQTAVILNLDQSQEVSQEFISLCQKSMQELGRFIRDNYEGSFLSFIDSCGGSAAVLVEALSQLSFFRDVHSYKGFTIPFLKRAQITAADIQLSFRHIGEKVFSDIESLTMFPDNAVPKVLRADGLLEYSKVLDEKIKRGEEITASSEEEIELRASAGFVVEEISRIRGMVAMDVDHILWHRGTDNLKYKKLKSHKTRTIFY
jgi:hypothetical protein